MSVNKIHINPDNLAYRKGVGLMILNAEGHVWVGQRCDTGNLIGGSQAWQMPQGGIDGTETPWQAALREMKEEIGTTNVRLIAESRGWISYDFPEELHTTLWGGRFFGQTQKWFLVEFLGDDSEININTRHPEFVAWRWIEPHQLPNLIVAFKQELYRKILEEFKENL
ncbi:MAG: RNA pyrophosphohydrolase [Candidatus Paracaedibacter sp.]|jgi:putative (di)nucleoside polyphosphate hydrolase